MRNTRKRLGLLKWSNICCFALWAFMPSAVHAQKDGEGQAVSTYENDYLRAELFNAGEQKTPEGIVRQAVLKVELEEGWHSYWRSPGDTGLPTRFQWRDGDQDGALTVHWPLPERIQEQNFTVFGYHGDVYYPLDIKMDNDDFWVDIKVSTMICKEICIPVRMRFKEMSDGSKELYQEAYAQVPRFLDKGPMAVYSIIAGPEALVINAYSQEGFEDFDIFVEVVNSPSDRYALTAKPKIVPNASNEQTAMIVMAAPEGVDNMVAELSGKDVIVTLRQGDFMSAKKQSF